MNLKLCIECQHCRGTRMKSGKVRYTCAALFRSPIDGVQYFDGATHILDCKIVRQQFCGISGTHWEKRKPNGENPT